MFSRISVRYIDSLNFLRRLSTTSPECRVRLSTRQATMPASVRSGLSRSRTVFIVSTSCATPARARTWASTGTINSRAAVSAFKVRMPSVGGVSIST
jgi:hypothetical protein